MQGTAFLAGGAGEVGVLRENVEGEAVWEREADVNAAAMATLLRTVRMWQGDTACSLIFSRLKLNYMVMMMMMMMVRMIMLKRYIDKI